MKEKIKRMVCLNPKIAYRRKYMPINGNITQRNLKRLNRISFKYKPGWEQIELPCGECPACRLAKANEYATRIQCEAETWHGIGCFVTLTYNNKNLPINDKGYQTLQPRDMQLYKKRLRKFVHKKNQASYFWENPKTGKLEKPVRTFEAGEYGTKNGRPHYHQIIFNWEPQDLEFDKMSKDGYPLYKSKTLQKIWGKGFVIIGKISFESASYVAQYTMKKNGIAKTKRKYFDTQEYDEELNEIVMKRSYKTIKGNVEPEFIRMSTSPGLGYHYFHKNIDKIRENGGILVNQKGTVKLKAVPRYFRKLWEKLDWQDYERWKLKNRQQAEEKQRKLIESYKLPDNWTMFQKEKFVRQELLDKQKHKFGLLKRCEVLYEDEDKL